MSKGTVKFKRGVPKSEEPQNVSQDQSSAQEVPVQEEVVQDSRLPVYNVDLSSIPSQGKSYPGDATISYTPYTFKIMKRIARTEETFPAISAAVMEGLNASFPIRDLTFPDFMFISLLRRMATMTDGLISVTAQCKNKECKNDVVFPVRISGSRCELEFDDLTAPELPVVVDLSFGTHSFMPMTIEQYVQLCNLGLGQDDAAELAIGCKTLPFKEAYERISEATGEDAEWLGAVEDDLYHGVRPNRAKCSKCGSEFKVRIDSWAVIIKPFRDVERPVENRIRYGHNDAPESA